MADEEATAYLTAYRLADPEFSTTREDMLSGHGAYLYGGRWNSVGRSMVYLGDSIAQVSMEVLAHGLEIPVLDQYCLLMVQIPTDCLLKLPASSLPDGWDREDAVNPVSQRVGDSWLVSDQSLALMVPSIAVPGGRNIVLNPNHRYRSRLVVGAIEEYRLDDRIRRLV
jgi:RES domain-containing protein